MSLRLRLTLHPPRDLTLRVEFDEVALHLSRRHLAAAGAAATFLVASVLYVFASGSDAAVPYPFEPIVSPMRSAPEVPLPWPQSLATTADDVVVARFTAGSTLDATLRSAGVEGSDLTALIAAASASIDVRRIRPGQEYQLYLDADGSLEGFRYQIDRQSAWFLARQDEEWTAYQVAIPVETRAVFISAEIIDSLHRALAAHAPTRGSVNELALRINDLYGWDVDFQYDLRYGDRLDLIVEERYAEGAFIGYGDVLAADFSVAGQRLAVIRYQEEDGSTSYFTPEGASLRRTFLRSPVKYSRISSRFTQRRVHPVTGIARAHRGVDYVAYPGTPVQATADGVIGEAGYGAEPGRYVKIRHGGSYASIYMHLSRIESGIKAGTEVKQGDIVGYVGKTGNATGYHLHYGLEQAGRWVDPLRLQFPAADPVPRQHWNRFLAQRDAALGRLEAGQSRRAAAIAGGGL